MLARYTAEPIDWTWVSRVAAMQTLAVERRFNHTLRALWDGLIPIVYQCDDSDILKEAIQV